MWRNQSRYRRHVSRGLDRARRKAQVRSIPLDGSRLVLFSDLHRGMGDRADDFLACRKIYHAALGYYDHLEFELFLLGDVEELWERPLAGVIDHYEGTLALERKFFSQGRGHRLLGNHDESLEWAWNRAQIDRFTEEAPLRESLVLRWLDSRNRPVGEMMLVHGHQGIRYTWLDRMVVKRFWAPIQRLTGIRTGVPSADHSIRRTHETALYDWARTQENLLLVCGHTHHPVFMSAAWEQAILRDLDDLVETGASEEEVAMKQAHLQWVAAELDEVRSALPEDPRPCYFNTGCCSFNDGSITGIEIESGRIRLVRWSGESGDPIRQVIREGLLADVFGRCGSGECEESDGRSS